MRVQPDAEEAHTERTAAGVILSTVLDRVRSQLGDATERVKVSPEALLYPGMFAVAYEAQAACRAPELSQGARDRIALGLQGAVQRASDSRARAANGDCPAWPLDLAPPEGYLCDSLARAVSQVPQRPDRIEALSALCVADWSDADRAGFCEAASLLAATWTQMLAELTVVVQQIALLNGFGVDGFTDIATHGAVYVNRARLGADGAGLPGPMRMAEAIVHEGAHNRCNAAALSDPFLADPGSGSEPVVMTPLRQDPRPLTGLLQQLVVLVRSVLLYDRLLAAPDPPGAAVARREKLRAQASEALRVIGAHTGRLTGHGRAVVAEAGDLLARSAILAGS